ncbi:MAG: asparagine synthase C-terminal domain-containing protein, partial [Pseudomonadota bacterium]
ARDPFQGSPEEAVTELERLLDQSLAGQMLADVRLGAFLSGGIDSSVVVALMQRASAKPIKTFTIGFAEKQYNEADHARAVADYLKTEHTDFCVTPDDALALVPQLPKVYDEPFADMSQIPTMMVSRLARAEVTVALSGDGGDELFWGYGRYPQALDTWGKLARMPLWMRKAIKPMVPDGPIRHGFDMPDVQAFYRYLNTQWKGYSDIVIGASAVAGDAVPAELGPIGGMVLSDMAGYLPDDIMAKVDRAAMACSLETRAPLLDHRLVEFSWRLGGNVTMRNSVGKWPLKQLLYRHVPEALVNRPKMGFGVPIADWLRTSLRDWAEALLDERRLAHDGYFNAKAVRAEWETHLSGRDRHYGLWAILMYQAWSEAND